MAEEIKGYEDFELIRLDVGSPSSDFVFSTRSQAVMVDNLGSSPVYFRFDGSVGTGSIDGIVPACESRSFDARVGSVSVMSSGGTTNTVQCIRLE